VAGREIGKLMTDTYKEGVLSEGSMQALVAVPQIGTEIERGLGRVEDADFLVSVLADDSLSISGRDMQAAVRNGHNLILSVAQGQAGTCHFHTRYLNGTVLNAYGPAGVAEPMTKWNYELSPNGTPLYDQTLVLLGTVIAKWREAPDGARPRTFSVVISDGDDTISRSDPEAVARLVTDLLLNRNHIVAAIGIDDGSTDFRRVFGAMGIPAPWILTPEASAEQVAAAFKTIADALALGAGSPAAFRQLAAGPPSS
jgi:hypothetical protein